MSCVILSDMRIGMRVALQMGVTALWPKPVNSCDVAAYCTSTCVHG